jgi:hypothetical protein
MPNCPECGRLMALVDFENVGKSPWECYQWWVCGNEDNHRFEVDPIPAPEYQWIWACDGIPAEHLMDWPELLDEYKRLWDALPATYKKKYRSQSPEHIANTTTD